VFIFRKSVVSDTNNPIEVSVRRLDHSDVEEYLRSRSLEMRQGRYESVSRKIDLKCLRCSYEFSVQFV